MRIVWVVGFVPRTNIPAGRILCYHGTNVLSTTKSNLKTYFLLDLVRTRNSGHDVEKRGPWWLEISLRRQVMWSCCIVCGEVLGTVDAPSITSNSDCHLGIPAPGVVVTTRKRAHQDLTPSEVRVTYAFFRDIVDRVLDQNRSGLATSKPTGKKTDLADGHHHPSRHDHTSLLNPASPPGRVHNTLS